MQTLVDDHRQLETNALADGQPVKFAMHRRDMSNFLAPVTTRAAAF